MRRLILPHETGITLLELIAAVSVTCIAAGICTLNYPLLLESWRLEAATRQVVVDLKRARVRALADGTSHRLQFVSGQGSYQQQRQRGDLYEDNGPPVLLPTGITVTACSARFDSVSFHPRGHAGSFGTITISNRRGNLRNVIVDMVGRVRVE